METLHEIERRVEVVAPAAAYRRPPPQVIESHLAGHGHKLRLRRDVAWPGNRAKRPHVTLEPASFARPARVWCGLCPPGRDLHLVGAPERGPARRSWLRRTDGQLEALLRGVAADRHDELIDAYDRGELMPAILEGALTRRRQQTKEPAVARHDAEKRRKGAQGWMLARYAEVGNVDELQDELEQLLRENRHARLEILGEDTTRAKETLKGDWKRIPVEQREAARKQAHGRPAAERNADRYTLRAKLTP